MNIEIVDVTSVDFLAITKLSRMTSIDWDRIGHCYERSEVRWIGTVDSEIACMWGLIPPTLMSDRAYLWLFHTNIIEAYKFRFIRHSQVQMQRMLKIYPYIVGDCVITNSTGRRWLTWLGAKFGSPYGDDVCLVPFEIKAKANG